MSMESVCRARTVLCVACMCFLARTVRSSQPIFLWPFSNLTLTYEVMNGRDSEYYDDNECPELGIGHQDFDYGSFVFQRYGSYVEVEIRKGRQQSTITFAFFVFPYEYTGVILKYEADDRTGGTVHSLTVEMNNGVVEMTVEDENGQRLSHIESRHWIPIREWSFIGVCKNDQTYYLQVNSITDQDVTNSKVKFDAFGDIEIAKERQTAYRGRLCCLSVWDIKMPTQSDIKEWCFQKAWPNANPNPTCPASAPPVDVRPTHLWPLSLSSGGYNVINDSRPITPDNFQCAFTSRDTYKLTERPVIYLDGSVFSYMEAGITAVTTSNDFMVTIMIRPDNQVEGVIWDILISVTDQIGRLRLSLINGYAVFEIGNAQGTCSNVTSRGRIHGNTWSLLSAMVMVSNNTMAIFSDSGLASTQLRCRLPTNRGGIIRIGQSHDLQPSSNVGYHGSVACLAVFDGVVNGSSIETLVDKNCMPRDTQNRSVGKEDCRDQNGIKVRRFRMTAQNRCPSHESHPLSTSSVASLLQCSTECGSLLNCRSFAFNTTNSMDNCQRYNFVTQTGLSAKVGCNYYSVTHN